MPPFLPEAPDIGNALAMLISIQRKSPVPGYIPEDSTPALIFNTACSFLCGGCKINLRVDLIFQL